MDACGTWIATCLTFVVLGWKRDLAFLSSPSKAQVSPEIKTPAGLLELATIHQTEAKDHFARLHQGGRAVRDNALQTRGCFRLLTVSGPKGKNSLTCAGFRIVLSSFHLVEGTSSWL